MQDAACSVTFTGDPLRNLFFLTAILVSFPSAPVSANELDMSDKCYAPTKELTAELRSRFVEEIRTLAKQVERDHGVPAPILAAMAINESGYGTTQLAIATNNVLSYKWNSAQGPGGRGIYTLTCQPKEDKVNTYVIFRDHADSADFVASRLETAKYYKDATAAFRKAMAENKDRKAAAVKWLNDIAPSYNPYHTKDYIQTILRIADDPISQSGTLDVNENLWLIVHPRSSTKTEETVLPQPDAKKTDVESKKEHVEMVTEAQNSAYVIRDAIKPCSSSDKDVHGWPAKLIQDCTYRKETLTARALLVKVPSETIAAWIETECAKQLPGIHGCFEAVLVCGKLNSGMMFPISGNILEDMNATWTNWFFRNGITVRFKDQPNDTPTQVSLDRQDELIFASIDSIEKIPTGITRFWRTMPAQFRKRFSDRDDVPLNLETPENRKKWLDIAREEFLSALENPRNHLLEAWVAAHPEAIKKAAALRLQLKSKNNTAKKKELAPSDCPADYSQ